MKNNEKVSRRKIQQDELLNKLAKIESELSRIRHCSGFAIYKEDEEMVDLFYEYVCNVNKRHIESK